MTREEFIDKWRGKELAEIMSAELDELFKSENLRQQRELLIDFAKQMFFNTMPYEARAAIVDVWIVRNITT